MVICHFHFYLFYDLGKIQLLLILMIEIWYLQVAKLGYKSVAHYLIQTSRSNTRAENCNQKPVPGDQCSFTDEEPESLNHDDMDDEEEKVKLLDYKHVNADGEGTKRHRRRR